MLEDYKASELPTTHIIARELLACIAWGAMLPFGLKTSRLRTPRREFQRTVVFIHGYLSNRASFFPMSTYLRLHGVGQMLSFNYNSTVGVERAARELRDFLREKVRGGQIDLVCHSLGGVVARFYLQELGGSRRVNRCITLGTPHDGTYSSYWISSRVGQELRPDSTLMRRMARSKPRAASVKFSSFIGGSDNIVVPRVFATNGEDILHVPNVGHTGLLFSPTIFHEVARRLNEGS